MKQELVKQGDLSEAEIDQLVTVLKTGTAFSFILAIIIDFVFRFLVIDSLYHKYKEEVKPDQMA
jgi:hypothetical protein